MDLLLVLLSATVLTALDLVADRVGGDLRGGYRGAGGADRTVNDDRPMRLELLALSPEGLARCGSARADEATRAAAHGAAEARRPAVGTPDTVGDLVAAARVAQPARAGAAQIEAP